MNVQDVANRVRRTFGDEAGIQVTDADIFRWVNDAQLQISTDNESVLEAIGTSDIVSGQSEYALPTDMNILRSLQYKGFRLRPLSLAQFNEYIDGYSSTNKVSGVPEVFMVYANVATLYPTPNENVTAGLKIFFSKHPTLISTLADALTVPSRYHNAVVEYCLQQAYEMDESFDAAAYKRGKFDETVRKVTDQEKWTSQEYYPTITTLPEDDNFYGGYY